MIVSRAGGHFKPGSISIVCKLLVNVVICQAGLEITYLVLQDVALLEYVVNRSVQNFSGRGGPKHTMPDVTQHAIQLPTAVEAAVKHDWTTTTSTVRAYPNVQAEGSTLELG